MLDRAVNPDLAYASSYVLHGPPVRRLLAELHSLELVTGRVPCLWRERSQLLPRAAYP